MTPDEIERVVVEVVTREPAVLAAWIFGSRVRGEARPGSDLDIALLADPNVALPAGIEERVGAEIAGRTKLDVDVSRIGEDRPVLAFEAVSDGRRVYARDPERADVVEEQLRWVYLDTQHLRRVQNHYLFGDPL